MSGDITNIVASQSSTTTPALTTTYAVRPAYSDGRVMDVAKQGSGRISAATYFAKATEASGGGFTGISFKIQISQTGDNPTDATATNWITVSSTRLSDNTTAFEWTLSVGVGATAWDAYACAGILNAPFRRVLMKSTGANAGAGDLGIITEFAS